MTLDGLRLAATLLTVIPIRQKVYQIEVTRGVAGAAIAWSPLVGLVLGAVAAAVLYGASQVLGPLTGAVLAVAVLAALTRGLHLDGLADLADGLGSGRPAEQALEIMRNSDIGPFGVVTLMLTLLVQVAALAHAGPGRRGEAALIAAVVTGRLAIVWACRPGVPAARASGLGAMVAGTVRPAVAAALTAVGLAVAGVLATTGIASWTLPVAVAAGLLASLALAWHATRRLGGITGDVLGGIAETAATVCLLIAAAT